MSDEESTTQNASLWSVLGTFVKSPSLVFVVLGVALYVVAALGSWGKQGLSIERDWRIFLAVVATVLIGIGVALLWRSYEAVQDGPRRDRVRQYGVEITYPIRDIPVGLQIDRDRRPYLPVKGKIKVLPKDAEIWVFVVGGDGQLWPHGPATVERGEWIVEQLRPGLGDQKRIQAYVVGRNGRALIKCFRTVARGIWDGAAQIKARYPESSIELRTPGITELTTDMVMCHEVKVTVEHKE